MVMLTPKDDRGEVRMIWGSENREVGDVWLLDQHHTGLRQVEVG